MNSPGPASCVCFLAPLTISLFFFLLLSLSGTLFYTPIYRLLLRRTPGSLHVLFIQCGSIVSRSTPYIFVSRCPPHANIHPRFFFWLYLSINLFTSLVVSYSIHFVFPSPSLCWIFFFFWGGVSFFKSVLLCSAFARVGRAGLIVCFALNVWAAVCRGGGGWGVATCGPVKSSSRMPGYDVV